MIYAADELQNPLPHAVMLFEGDRNRIGWRNDFSPNCYGLRLSIQHCMKEEGGLTIVNCSAKIGGERKLF